MTNEIARQILIEIDELAGRIQESIELAKLSFIVTMYREILRQKQDELRLLSD